MEKLSIVHSSALLSGCGKFSSLHSCNSMVQLSAHRTSEKNGQDLADSAF